MSTCPLPENSLGALTPVWRMSRGRRIGVELQYGDLRLDGWDRRGFVSASLEFRGPRLSAQKKLMKSRSSIWTRRDIECMFGPTTCRRHLMHGPEEEASLWSVSAGAMGKYSAV